MNDKLMHLLAGVAISLLFGWLAHDALAGFIVALLAIIITNDIVVGLLASFVAGAAKEIWDYFGHGTSEFGDFLATVQGGVIGAFIIWVVA